MSGYRLDKKIYDIIKSHPKVGIAEKTISNEISKIRADYPGINMNAAAAIFAKRRSFSIIRHLSAEDKRALQNAAPIMQKAIPQTKSPTPKVSQVSLVFGQQFLKNANSNAQLYPYVYILENTLRQLILDTFGNNLTWWENKVPRKVKEYAQNIKEAEKKHNWISQRGNHPIYYVGLNELGKIIIKNHSSFNKIFPDQNRFRTWIDESIPIRHRLAHNVPIKLDDRQYFKTRCRYICTLIEKNKKQ